LSGNNFLKLKLEPAASKIIAVGFYFIEFQETEKPGKERHISSQA
jgi:hypothetical protein